MYTNEAVKARVLDLEKKIAKLVGEQMRDVDDPINIAIEHEVILSAAAAFTARVVGLVHVNSREPTASLRQRVDAGVDVILPTVIEKFRAQVNRALSLAGLPRI